MRADCLRSERMRRRRCQRLYVGLVRDISLVYARLANGFFVVDDKVSSAVRMPVLLSVLFSSLSQMMEVHQEKYVYAMTIMN